MEEDFYAALAADAGVAAIVAERIGFGTRPADEPAPAVALFTIGGPGDYDLDGTIVADTAYRVQIDCWAPDYEAAELLARAVTAALKAEAFAAAPFQGVFLIDLGDDDAPADGPDAATGSERLFRARRDVRVWHATTA